MAYKTKSKKRALRKGFFSRTGTRLKNTYKRASSSVKRKASKSKSGIVSAYEIGYTSGWEDAFRIPNNLGAPSSAAVGYKKGITQSRKTKKYTTAYNSRKAKHKR